MCICVTYVYLWFACDCTLFVHLLRVPQEAYESDTAIFIVTELLSGGELFDHIVERGKFSENMAATAGTFVLAAAAAGAL